MCALMMLGNWLAIAAENKKKADELREAENKKTLSEELMYIKYTQPILNEKDKKIRVCKVLSELPIL